MTLYNRVTSNVYRTHRMLGVVNFRCNGHSAAPAMGPYVWEDHTIGKNWWIDSNYAFKRAAGAHLAPNPYLRIDTIVRRPLGTTQTRYCTGPCPPFPSSSMDTGQQLDGVHWGYESDLSDPGLAVSSDSDMRVRSMNKAILSAKADLSLLLSDFFQRKQTEKMLGDTVMKLVRVVRAVHKKDVAGAFRALGGHPPRRRLSVKDPAKLWLEIQYGWKPLLADMYDVFEAMKPITALVKSRGRAKEVVRNRGKAVGYGVVVYYDQYVEKRINSNLYFTFPGDGSLLQSAQQGVLAPLEVLWDLLPWSFIIDWIAPIGDYFQALNSSVSLQYVDGTSSVKQKTWDRRVSEFRAPSCGYSAGRYEWSWEQSRLQRYVEPNAVYQFRCKNPFSFTHLANAIALLTTAVGGVSVRGR